MSDEIELSETDDEYRDATSNEIPLGTALSEFECPECGVSPTWVLDPDPDALAYRTQEPCNCGYKHYIKPTKVVINRIEAGL